MVLFSDFKQLFYTFIVLSISLKVKLNINQCREILFVYHFLDQMFQFLSYFTCSWPYNLGKIPILC